MKHFFVEWNKKHGDQCVKKNLGNTHNETLDLVHSRDAQRTAPLQMAAQIKVIAWRDVNATCHYPNSFHSTSQPF